MPDPVIPLDMGFAEFAAKLIEETFESVVQAAVLQEEKINALLSAAALAEEEYARRIGDDTVVDALEAEFGQSFKAGTIVPESMAEELLRKISVKLRPGDLVTSSRMLTADGAARIREAMRLDLARREMENLQRLAQRGIPRVVVDAGHIRAKLAFEWVKTEDAAKPEVAKRFVTPIRPLRRAGTDPDLNKVRLVVRQADERAPQTSGMLLGEVEVSFKTVA
jgi:hypothetical protein